MRFSRKRPSPAIAISVVALVFAMAGTGLAGVATISVLSKHEKTQVRKIANKQIHKKASGLSVASAETAKRADTANTAGNATNQLWAIVNADGSLFRSSPGIVASAPLTPAGRYAITADRDVSGCYAVATLGGNSPGQAHSGGVSVNPVSGNQLLVTTIDIVADSASPNPFTLLIRC
jgi:hypothetical protein